jgi:hypothetical protein
MEEIYWNFEHILFVEMKISKLINWFIGNCVLKLPIKVPSKKILMWQLSKSLLCVKSPSVNCFGSFCKEPFHLENESPFKNLNVHCVWEDFFPQPSLVYFRVTTLIHVLSTILTTLRRSLPSHFYLFCENGDIMVKGII